MPLLSRGRARGCPSTGASWWASSPPSSSSTASCCPSLCPPPAGTPAWPKTPPGPSSSPIALCRWALLPWRVALGGDMGDRMRGASPLWLLQLLGTVPTPWLWQRGDIGGLRSVVGAAPSPQARPRGRRWGCSGGSGAALGDGGTAEPGAPGPARAGHAGTAPQRGPVRRSEPTPHFPAVGLGVPEGRGQLYRKTTRALRYEHRAPAPAPPRPRRLLPQAEGDPFVLLDSLRWLPAAPRPTGPSNSGSASSPSRRGCMSGGPATCSAGGPGPRGLGPCPWHLRPPRPRAGRGAGAVPGAAGGGHGGFAGHEGPGDVSPLPARDPPHPPLRPGLLVPAGLLVPRGGGGSLPGRGVTLSLSGPGRGSWWGCCAPPQVAMPPPCMARTPPCAPSVAPPVATVSL